MSLRQSSVLFAALLLLPSFLTAQNLLNGCEHVVYDSLYNRYLATSFYDGDVIQIDVEYSQDYFYQGPGNAYAMEIVGDTVYVTYGAAIRGLDRETGSPLWVVTITGGQQLDGIVSDTSGHIFIVDAVEAGRIWKLNISDRTYSLFIASGLPELPQDIAFDRENNRLLLASYAHHAPILAIDPEDGSSITELVITPFGYSDGIVMDTAGYTYITCYNSGRIYRYDAAYANPPVVISDGHLGPSGIGYNPEDHILAVSNFGGNRVDLIPLTDNDLDDVLDFYDNCPNDPNPGQEDDDDDGDGNACDGCPYDYNPEHEDTDWDGVEDACDNCPDDYNPEQEDTNGNDIGDVCDFICGDADNDRLINILDVVFMINYLYKSGATPEYPESVDVNNDFDTNILDIVYIINYIYKSGSEPTCP